MAVSQAELDQRIGRFVETFSRIGMKVTHQRAEIFREAAGSDEHLDAEMIYQRVRKRVTGISRDTVYRTVAGGMVSGEADDHDPRVRGTPYSIRPVAGSFR